MPKQNDPSAAFDISISGAAKARMARRRAANKARNAMMRAFRKAARDLAVPGPVPGEEPMVPPTAQTRLRHQKSSFARMCDAGEISGSMMRAATEIDFVYSALTGMLVARGMKMMPPTRGVPSVMGERAIDAYDRRYRPWARKLARARQAGGPPVLEVVIDVVIDARMLSAIDEERGWRHGFAKQLVRTALADYADYAGWGGDQQPITSYPSPVTSDQGKDRQPS